MDPPRLRLGELLVDARMITQEALDEALEQQKADGRRIGALLVSRGLINETQLTQILSHQLSVPWVSLLHIEFSRQLLNLVPRDTADRYCLVPIYVRHVRRQGDTLYVAMDDPSNEEALRECSSFSGLPTRAMIAPPSDIRNAIRVYYGGAQAKGASDVPPAAPSKPVSEAPRARRSERPSRPSRPSPGEIASLGGEAPNEVPEVPAPLISDAPTIEAVEIELPPRVEARARDTEEDEVKRIPRPKGGPKRRMISLTLLDGTTITLPARGKKARASDEGEEVVRLVAAGAKGHDEDDPGLTARDLVAAMRAVAHGADASEILGSTVRWEAMFAALLSLLLRKHLIADWEFVEEFKKI
jgi:type IV pilus assembly protein PilB